MMGWFILQTRMIRLGFWTLKYASIWSLLIWGSFSDLLATICNVYTIELCFDWSFRCLWLWTFCVRLFFCCRSWMSREECETQPCRPSSVLSLVTVLWVKPACSSLTPQTSFPLNMFLRWVCGHVGGQLITAEMTEFVSPTGVRQLCRNRDDRRRAIHFGSVWYSRCALPPTHTIICDHPLSASLCYHDVCFLQVRKTMTGYGRWVIHRQMCSWSVSLSSPPLPLKMSKKRWIFVLNSYISCHISVDQLFVICPWTVGSRDHPPLSKDTLPAGGDSDWLAGWPVHHREAGQEQAEAHHSGDGWEAGERPQGCKICGVLSTHAGTWLWIWILCVHTHTHTTDELMRVHPRSRRNFDHVRCTQLQNNSVESADVQPVPCCSAPSFLLLSEQLLHSC